MSSVQPLALFLPLFEIRFFAKCYMPSSVDPRDPRVSPSYAALHRFPRRGLIVTAAYDNLAIERERLAARLRETPRREVVSERIEWCNYAWDNMASRETPE